MSSFRRRSFRNVPRIKRNAERHIRAGRMSLPDSALTYTGYVYTAGSAQTVKSIKLDIGQNPIVPGAPTNPPTEPSPQEGVVYAIVVVREGYQANGLNWPALTTDMYNPTMDVLISGVLTDAAVEDHKWNRIGRKLKTGDRICLIAKATEGASHLNFELSFSVLT